MATSSISSANSRGNSLPDRWNKLNTHFGLSAEELNVYNQVNNAKVKKLFGQVPHVDAVTEVQGYTRSAVIDNQLREWHQQEMRDNCNGGQSMKAMQLLGMRGKVDLEYYRRFEKAARLLGDAPTRNQSKAVRILGDEAASE